MRARTRARTRAANPCSPTAPDLQTVTGVFWALALWTLLWAVYTQVRGLPSAEMKLVLMLCLVAKSLGFSWKVLEVLHWAASHVFIGAEAGEPTIWCNAKVQPATCQGSRHRAWSPWPPPDPPLGAAGRLTEPHRASQSLTKPHHLTWVTALTGAGQRCHVPGRCGP